MKLYIILIENTYKILCECKSSDTIEDIVCKIRETTGYKFNRTMIDYLSEILQDIHEQERRIAKDACRVTIRIPIELQIHR